MSLEVRYPDERSGIKDPGSSVHAPGSEGLAIGRKGQLVAFHWRHHAFLGMDIIQSGLQLQGSFAGTTIGKLFPVRRKGPFQPDDVENLFPALQVKGDESVSPTHGRIGNECSVRGECPRLQQTFKMCVE